jgi:hypothetical protein
VLEAQIAKRSSSERVQALAAGLGLESPTPKAVEYLKLRRGDPVTAAERLAAGDVSALAGLSITPELSGASLAPAPAAPPDASVTTESAPPPPPTADPAATVPPATAAPSPTQTPPASSAGGGVTP